MMDAHEPSQSAPTGKRNDKTKRPGIDDWIDGLIANLSGWHALIGGILVLLTAVANLEGFLDKQWKLAAATVVIALVGVAFWIVADRRRSVKTRRFAAFALIGVVGTASGGLFWYALSPRIAPDHAPIFAIARFDGPDLPTPYANCRPSDMLADSLADVRNRFHQLEAFELPYKIEPDGRWADLWALSHGWLQGADVVVYGEYSLVDRAIGSNQPDRILISPHVSAVPFIPLGWKRAPLTRWQLNPRLVAIDQLCSGTAARFINDAHRLGLAISALRLFSKHEFIGAQRALAEAEDVSGEIQPAWADQSGTHRQPKPASQCYGVSADETECSGILAFYLAALEQRSGNYTRAENEYRIATKKLDRAAPYIDLAELYALQCDWKRTLLALNFAVWADPSSVAALATRSEYEYEYGDRDQAQVDLKRAQSVKITSDYDRIALSRALHQRSDAKSKQQGTDEMRKALREGDFEKQQLLETRVEFATWLLDDGKVDESISNLTEVTDVQPDNISANYVLGLAYAAKRSLVKNAPADLERYGDMMKQGYLRALGGRAFTDEEYTTQGNAAYELNLPHQALTLYGQALRINPHAVYALSGRAGVYKRAGHYQLAIENYRAALTLHPNEKQLRRELLEAQNQLALDN